MIEPTVLIVGAGPTGMTLAIELARLGVSVRIVDKSEHLAEHSQALVLQARTLEQFQRYGIAAEAVARGRKLNKAKIWSDGKQIASVELDQIKSRYPYLLFLAQSETEEILNRKMESLGVKTERGLELVSLEQVDGKEVRCGLRRGDESIEEVRPRWVVGCDGAHSAVRSLSGIRFEGESISLSFFLGDLELDGPDVPDYNIAVHLHKGDVVFMGRLSERLTRLIVAFHRDQGHERPNTVSMADFQRAIDETGVQVQIRAADWMTPFSVNDRQAEHYRKASVFLAGDASHIHSPVGGQGMNTGIQDAANLAWKLALVAEGGSESLLDSYEQERGAVGKALLRRTGLGLKVGTSANFIVEHVRDALLPLVAKSETARKAISGFVSETAIQYRDSPIIEDHGGDGTLRAGDRMPDLSLGDGTLLGEWTKAEPVIIQVSSGESIERCGVKLVRVDDANLSDEGKALLGSAPKVVVLRPDGYVGYRGPAEMLDGHMWRYGVDLL